jgi:hypothetical protein
MNRHSPDRVRASRGTARPCIIPTLIVLLLCGLLADAGRAQGPRRTLTTLEAVRQCPRAECLLTLERGTVDGTRLRVGDPGVTRRVGITGWSTPTQFTGVPEAVALATHARNQKLGANLAAIAALAANAYIWTYNKNDDDPGRVVARRFTASLATASAGYGLWYVQTRRAEVNLDKAVERYNRELPR